MRPTPQSDVPPEARLGAPLPRLEGHVAAGARPAEAAAPGRRLAAATAPSVAVADSAVDALAEGLRALPTELRLKVLQCAPLPAYAAALRAAPETRQALSQTSDQRTALLRGGLMPRYVASLPAASLGRQLAIEAGWARRAERATGATLALRPFASAKALGPLVASPSGEHVACVGGGRAQLLRIADVGAGGTALARGGRAAELGVNLWSARRAQALCFGDGGRRLYVATQEAVQIYDVGLGLAEHVVPLGALGLAQEDGRRPCVALQALGGGEGVFGLSSRRLSLWQTHLDDAYGPPAPALWPEPVAQLALPLEPKARAAKLLASPGGQLVWIRDDQGQAYLSRRAEAQLVFLHRLGAKEAGPSDFRLAAFGAHERTVGLINEQRLKLFDVRRSARDEALRLGGDERQVVVQTTPGGQWLTGGCRGEVNVWDLRRPDAPAQEFQVGGGPGATVFDLAVLGEAHRVVASYARRDAQRSEKHQFGLAWLQSDGAGPGLVEGGRPSSPAQLRLTGEGGALDAVPLAGGRRVICYQAAHLWLWQPHEGREDVACLNATPAVPVGAAHDETELRTRTVERVLHRPRGQ